MKLWIETDSIDSARRTIKVKAKEVTKDINRKALSRATRAINAMRNAELEVLKGQGSGRVYRKPYTKKATYTASAPGEVPARRTGSLRLHWNGNIKQRLASSGGISIIVELESQEKYAAALEHGTSKMAARPYAEKIKEKARSEIERIYSESYQ